MWSFNIPFPIYRRYAFGKELFIVRSWKDHPVSEYLSTNRAAFFKLFHLTSGNGRLIAGLHNHLLKPGDVAFVRPNELILWRTFSDDIAGHFCFVHPRYFKHANHVLDMFLHFPYAHPADAVVCLNRTQSETVQQCFERMHQEVVGNHDDRKQAILLHLQMILLKVRRAARTNSREKSS